MVCFGRPGRLGRAGGADVENARIDCDELVRGRATPSAGGRMLGAVLAVRVRGAVGDEVCEPGRDVAVPGRGMPPDGERSCFAPTPPDGERSCGRATGNWPVFEALVAPDEFLPSVARGTPLDSVIVRGLAGSVGSAGVGTRLTDGSVGTRGLDKLVGVGLRVSLGVGTRPCATSDGVGDRPRRSEEDVRVGVRGSVGVRPVAGSFGVGERPRES